MMATLVRAIPKKTSEILGSAMEDISPGLRFSTYFGGYEESGWKVESKEKAKRFREVCGIGSDILKLSEALFLRQKDLWKDGPSCLALEASTTSPFATGLGIEHPLENGFSFLKPYGLPYLPGSGLKGVLRAAALEMGEEEGWSSERVTQLLGGSLESGDREDSDSSHRGELIFFDAYPKMKKESLTVEIMNPHHGNYYAGISSPSGIDAPVPVFFLAISPGTEFFFHVSRVPRTMSASPSAQGEWDWKELVVRTFVYAFTFLGFGAKTAVGYGAFKSNELESKEKKIEIEKAEAETKALLSSGVLPPDHVLWENARLSFTPNDGRIKIAFTKDSTPQRADLDRGMAESLISALSPDDRDRLKVKRKEITLPVVMKRVGNQWSFVQIKQQ